jgi:acetylornithine/succinyldiaminopimelate/putrescine aminotransferase
MISNRELFLQHLGQTSSSPYMLEIENAEGIYLYTSSKKKLVDLIAGVSVSNLGHKNPEIIKAVQKQAEKYMHLMVYGEYIQSPQVLLAEKIQSILPEKLNSVYFVNSGSEAVEAALKLAKRYTRRTQIIAYINAYHGSTHGALSVTGNEAFKNSFRPLLPDIHHLNLNNFEELERINHNTACVILEPIQGEAGIRITDEKYMLALRKRCDETGCLLIFDEIQTGFGRTGKLFALEHYSIIPDIVCMAKAMGAGMPLGGIVAPKEIMNHFMTDPVLGHITTFGGHPVSCAASLAGINILLNNQLHIQAKEKGELFKSLLTHPAIAEVRGSGLFIAVELNCAIKVQNFIQAGLKIGFITDWFIFCDSSFRIAPPLTISKQEIVNCVTMINEALDLL